MSLLLLGSGTCDSGGPLGYFGSSLSAWYDFADPTKVWADTAGTTPITENTGIALVQDKSGNAQHFEQGTAANTGLWQDWGNGLFAWTGQDADDHLDGNTAALGLVRNVSAISVVSIVTLPNVTSGTQRIFYASANSGVGSTRFNHYCAATRLLATQTRIADGGTADLSPSSVAYTAGQLAVVITTIDYTTGAGVIYRNNASDVSWTAAWTPGSATTDSASAGVSIGGRGDGIDGFLEAIGEIMIFKNKVLTSAERSYIQSYASSKWGV